ncbi:MAG: hypothetical protein A3A97_01405 [Candidatus Terrybacteria bacterium RIFCSPLOWO2_01_FULL_40_23]|uniref:Reverse transcriptase domain-containing protein n=1 Tax=Candidatus Terrybacteria bacterium RIFCSPLOWO2_01_FULL_40_23 TaxID=1802366 RepID=A0A1G2PQ69_9BACT|nr:MAG: hypothetical protein A3A97_01405 [Candidatus Terrybacteria bacterium RIFCSPLOWO2_01_FULL_40_23]
MNFNKLFSPDNLFKAWFIYRRGKTKKFEVIAFERNIERELFLLSGNIISGSYRHGVYDRFSVQDVKKREINTASIRDKIIHQVIHCFLTEVYEKTFSEHSFSSRVGKGTDKAVDKLSFFLRSERNWHYGKCFALKCDIKKYFDNINHNILIGLIRRKIIDKKTMAIIEEIIRSFEREKNKGLPLGNVTSQIFANIYLNELDCFVEKDFKIRKYIRYNDDFVIVDSNKKTLESLKGIVRKFLKQKLQLDTPKNKTVIRKFDWGIEFLGRIILPNAVILRSKTKTKILRNLSKENKNSYLGLLVNLNEFKFSRKLLTKLTLADWDKFDMMTA